MKLGNILLGSLSLVIVATSLASAGSQKIFDLKIDTIDTQGTLSQIENTPKQVPTPTSTQTNIPSPEMKPAAEAEEKTLSINKLPEGTPINILIIGSDTREGEANSEYGDPQKISGARADSTILININSTRKSATVVSIPRDLVIDIPECFNSANGKTINSRKARFNEAYAFGGPGCAVKTTSKIFEDLPIHHIMILDFSGFAKIIDTIGGLDICLDYPLKDKKSKLNLPAGEQTINGTQALALARARYSLSDGSDIARIDRQQVLLKQILSQMKEKNLQSNPIALYNVAQSFLSSLALDEKLSDPTIFTSLVFTGLGLEDNNINYTTVPWVPRGDNATLSIDEQKLPELISTLKNMDEDTLSTEKTFNDKENMAKKETILEKKPTAESRQTKNQSICKNPLF
jgi:LCP family protein required for cell wall assembly